MSNLAAAFPGQGVQKIGMADNLSSDNKKLFSAASEILGYDLLKICNEGPQDKLNKTKYAQPAIMITCLAIWSSIEEQINPKVLLGHSVGQVTAAVAGKSISFEDGVKVIAKRGELMDSCAIDGGMVAVLGLEDEQVRQLCIECSQDGYLTVANYNSPGQVVVSGEKKQLDNLMKAAEKQGARRVVSLNVSGPFHSKLMNRAASEFKQYLDHIEFSNPTIPIISNSSNNLMDSNSEIKTQLVKQITSPVRWVDNINLLKELDIEELVEVSPSPILIGLIKRINRNLILNLA